MICRFPPQFLIVLFCPSPSTFFSQRFHLNSPPRLAAVEVVATATAARRTVWVWPSRSLMWSSSQRSLQASAEPAGSSSWASAFGSTAAARRGKSWATTLPPLHTHQQVRTNDVDVKWYFVTDPGLSLSAVCYDTLHLRWKLWKLQ